MTSFWMVILRHRGSAIMSEFTNCINYYCKIRGTCWRAARKSDKFWQKYTKFEPNLDGTCEYFLEIPSDMYLLQYLPDFAVESYHIFLRDNNIKTIKKRM